MKRAADYTTSEEPEKKVARIEHGPSTIPVYENAFGIPGLTFVPDIIDEDEESRLLRDINTEKWLPDLGRRVQHYGHKYDYRTRKVVVGGAPPFPAWLDEIHSKIQDRVSVPNAFTQVIVNEYTQNQGITPHIDSQEFSSCIASLSMGAASVMVFARGGASIPVRLPRRSLVILQGDARYKYTHSIPKKISGIPAHMARHDADSGAWTPYTRPCGPRLSTRVSITFRSLSF